MKASPINRLGIVALTALSLVAFAGCTTANSSESPQAFKAGQSINVVSREEGSGTRGAFIELFGVEVKVDGNKTDHTTKEATVVNKTDVMLTTVSTDAYAIGYVSMGSLSDAVKPLTIGGVAANADNVKNGSYEIARPFLITTKSGVSDVAQDFIGYILSKEGQTIISSGYIPVNDAAQAYAGSGASGKIVVAGSSSVTPIMEKLKEGYAALNPSVDIEIQMSDSTAGITGTVEGICDIGMSSRALKDEEAAKVQGQTIAMDGIAVIVNPGNPMADATKDQIRAIFTGEVATWSDVK